LQHGFLISLERWSARSGEIEQLRQNATGQWSKTEQFPLNPAASEKPIDAFATFPVSQLNSLFDFTTEGAQRSIRLSRLARTLL
jgi:hypothetical protein